MANKFDHIEGPKAGDIKSEDVRQHTRMAAGAWIDGMDLPEQRKATMPEANSDHGDFESARHIKRDNQ